MDDSATLWIAIGSLSVSLAGVAWQVWNGRRIHRATLPIVDVSYTLWKSERNGKGEHCTNISYKTFIFPGLSTWNAMKTIT